MHGNNVVELKIKIWPRSHFGQNLGQNKNARMQLSPAQIERYCLRPHSLNNMIPFTKTDAVTTIEPTEMMQKMSTRLHLSEVNKADPQGNFKATIDLGNLLCRLLYFMGRNSKK